MRVDFRVIALVLTAALCATRPTSARQREAVESTPAANAAVPPNVTPPPQKPGALVFTPPSEAEDEPSRPPPRRHRGWIWGVVVGAAAVVTAAVAVGVAVAVTAEPTPHTLSDISFR